MVKDRGVWILAMLLAAETALFATDMSRGPEIWREVLFAVLMAGTGGLLVSRIRLRRKLERMASELQRAVQGNWNTRLFTDRERMLDGVIFAANGLIEELEKVRIRNVRSEAARKSLLSNISHDIRTPLTSMIGYVDALKDGVAASEEERRDYLEIIAAKAGGLKELLDGIFQMAKLDADDIPMQMEELDLAETVRESVIAFWPELAKNGIELIAHIPDVPCPVTADRLGMQRILGNLIKNALQYGREGRVLGVSLEEGPADYRVEVWDRGPGIPQAELPRIFERMYRTDRSRTLQSGGSGLGLAIAKALIGKHGGTIWAESEPGARTAVVFTLPKRKGSGDLRNR